MTDIGQPLVESHMEKMATVNPTSWVVNIVTNQLS